VAKIETMIGFAIKAGKIIFGAERIVLNKTAKLIIICASLADNSKKKLLEKLSKKQQVIISKNLLEDIVFKTNCKAIAISDTNFVKAILQSLDENYTLISL